MAWGGCYFSVGAWSYLGLDELTISHASSFLLPSARETGRLKTIYFMKQLLLSILLYSLVGSKVIAQTYGGGSGTENDPYLISSKADMETLADVVNSGNNYSDRYFLLTRDLTGENDTITTIIGISPTYCFSGIFDGGGYEITMNINVSNSSNSYCGVFGYLASGTVKNLGISGSISSSFSSYSFPFSGGICGYAYGSMISNCYNKGNISISGHGSSQAGGICGSMIYTTIKYCHNNGDVYSYSSASGATKAYAGGICAEASQSSLIENCYNNSENIYSGTNSNEYASKAYSGGICGIGEAYINNCFVARGNILSKTEAGRITALNSNKIRNCYASSSVLINDEVIYSEDPTNRHGKDFEKQINSCAHTKTEIYLLTTNTIKWEKSADNGFTWEDISCTNFYYTEESPSSGTYIYRALNNDMTYSEYIIVNYFDTVPKIINISPINKLLTVNESITFTLEIENNNYKFQWYKDNIALEGEVSNTYNIKAMTHDDEGSYFCLVSGCNVVSSEVSTIIYSPPYSGGNGTESYPFLISSKKDMETLANAVNSGINYEGKCFLLTQNVTGVSSIIGELESKSFCGVFDGGGYKITVDIIASSKYGGVFGYISNSTIKNLSVDGKIVSSYDGYAGGICGYANFSIIDNCFNEGSISFSNYIGGICGYANSSTIKKSYNLGNISSYSNTSGSGGICGLANSSSIDKCYNNGNILSLPSSSKGTPFAVGGICGLIYSSSIKGSSNMSEIVTSHSFLKVGGICGQAKESFIDSCSNENGISSVTNYYDWSFTGGICGEAYDSPIENCNNIGDISLSSYLGGSYSGGICGRANSLIKNCHNTANIYSSISTSSPSTQDTSYSCAGGICGWTSSNVEDCHNTGDISSKSDIMSYTSVLYYVYSGGVCGWASSLVKNCYNTGSISSKESPLTTRPKNAYYHSGGICGKGGSVDYCLNTGNIFSYNSAGGICGSITSAYGEKNTARNCIVSAKTIDGQYVGRIVGYKDSYGVIENCHALSSILINKNTIHSEDPTSIHGKDLEMDAQIVLYDGYSLPTSTPAIILLNTTNTIKWERSADNGFTWEDIACVSNIYIEFKPNSGAFIYRALNGDGTYSNYIMVVYYDASGINNVNSVEVQAYPNPVKDYLYIKSEQPIEHVSIYSQMGGLVMSESNVNDRIDVSALSSGVYIIKVFIENRIITQKIIIQ